jgi:hypothetical protein
MNRAAFSFAVERKELYQKSSWLSKCRARGSSSLSLCVALLSFIFSYTMFILNFIIKGLLSLFIIILLEFLHSF